MAYYQNSVICGPATKDTRDISPTCDCGWIDVTSGAPL